MQKNTFSKRRTKFAGLCGAILATATVAVTAGTTVQADETSQATDTTIATQQTTTAGTTAQEDQTPVFETETASVATPVNNEVAANSVASSQAEVNAPVVQAAPATTQAQTAPASAASENTNTATNNKPASAAGVYTKPENTSEYGSVDFDTTLNNASKSAPVTEITYNGSRDEYITVDDPNQAYTPNPTAITQYLNEYLQELRQINGISVPVPDANTLMNDFAQARANEEAGEVNGIDHQTSLAFPSGVTIYSENGHQDQLSSITPTVNGQSLGSDKATAYYLALNWFADYFNIASGTGEEAFGHAISILSNSGDGMSVGIANGTGAESDMFYAMLEIGSNSNVRNDSGFTTAKGADGNWVLSYNGQQVKFLPRTIFHYVSQNATAATPETPQAGDNPAANPTDPTTDPDAGNAGAGNGQTATTPTVPTTTVTPKTADLTKAGMGSTNPSKQESLPTTGDSKQGAITALGTALVMVGAGLIATRKLKSED
ncbi:putative cross-wall-targeting lipoprotein signal domain-containing protein [Streptococcus dentapri]|uniref:Cross-wall-targeting lipoprotein signal domain-containing protein n=1 Tax=Streptococcus dentapri TaxID=573564 RepID=A0ABV8D0S9_9STRE